MSTAAMIAGWVLHSDRQAESQHVREDEEPFMHPGKKEREPGGAQRCHREQAIGE